MYGLARRGLRGGWRRLKSLAVPRGSRPVILMYHRVAEPPFDPWGLCVSPDNFRAQMEMLKTHRHVMSVDDLVAALEAGEVPKFAAAITFDDGYGDNALLAKPVLEELQLPATFFLTSKTIGEGLFWWDELALLVLACPQAADFEVEIGGKGAAVCWDAQDVMPPDLPGWRAEHGGKDQRRSTYLRLWALLQQSGSDARMIAMAELRSRLGGSGESRISALDMPMSESMARTLASPMISPGGHGQTHMPLAGLPAKRQIAEISGGRADITAMTGGAAPIGFAYPHGSMDEQARRYVIEAGYSWAVVTDDLPVNPRAFDRYALPRIGAGNWSAETLRRKLR